jgi:hypothetical protein
LPDGLKMKLGTMAITIIRMIAQRNRRSMDPVVRG